MNRLSLEDDSSVTNTVTYRPLTPMACFIQHLVEEKRKRNLSVRVAIGCRNAQLYAELVCVDHQASKPGLRSLIVKASSLEKTFHNSSMKQGKALAAVREVCSPQLGRTPWIDHII